LEGLAENECMELLFTMNVERLNFGGFFRRGELWGCVGGGGGGGWGITLGEVYYLDKLASPVLVALPTCLCTLHSLRSEKGLFLNYM
jgi:hypothetical protein